LIAVGEPGHCRSRDEVSWPYSKVSPASLADAGIAEQSIESLVAQHYGFVWRVLRGLGLSRDDADDAAQQVFMTAAGKLDRIAPNSARSFVYGAALRVANNTRRGLKRRREVAGDHAEEPIEPAAFGPEQSVELARARALLAELLRQLPDKFRRVLILAELEQLEVPDIAALERLPVGTAASRLRVARQQFRELLETARDRNPFVNEP
jgi:RNA polymerase sigma-70 factor, ECF subfamily